MLMPTHSTAATADTDRIVRAPPGAPRGCRTRARASGPRWWRSTQRVCSPAPPKATSIAACSARSLGRQAVGLAVSLDQRIVGNVRPGTATRSAHPDQPHVLHVGQQLGEAFVRRVVALHRSHQDAHGGAPGLEHQLAVAAGQRERLLHHHAAPGARGGDRDRRVVARGGDEHDIQRLGRDQLLRAGEHPRDAIPALGRTGHLRCDVAHRRRANRSASCESRYGVHHLRDQPQPTTPIALLSGHLRIVVYPAEARGSAHVYDPADAWCSPRSGDASARGRSSSLHIPADAMRDSAAVDGPRSGPRRYRTASPSTLRRHAAGGRSARA